MNSRGITMTKIPSRRCHVVTAMQRMTTSSGTNIPRAADETSVARTTHTYHTREQTSRAAFAARAHGELHMQLRENLAGDRTGKKERREESAHTRARHRERGGAGGGRRPFRAGRAAPTPILIKRSHKRLTNWPYVRRFIGVPERDVKMFQS